MNLKLSSVPYLTSFLHSSITIPKQWVNENNALYVFPHEHGLDGIFAVRMKKIF